MNKQGKRGMPIDIPKLRDYIRTELDTEDLLTAVGEQIYHRNKLVNALWN